MGVIDVGAGEILVDGYTVPRGSACFSYMPQADLLLPWLTVLQNACLYGRIHGRVDEAARRARALFPAFGLAGYEDAYPNKLSGGMRQRAAFLRTALCGHEIVLLDEPFGALDVITRGTMQDWLLSKRASLTQTGRLVTHDVDEAIYLADRILLIGGSPAAIQREIVVESAARTREWLIAQAPLRAEIYRTIKALTGE
jgi:ABC-type nitrate/sulfonate/bicarbonate transport system ATPase subunit